MNLTALTLGVFVLVTPTICVSLSAQEGRMQKPDKCGTPVAVDDGWQIDTPEALGFDRARLCTVADRLQAADDVHSIVVARHGRLVFEQYFAGYDEPWGHDDKRYDFDATMKHDMRSVSKSVISLLTGIAINRHLIDGADAPVLQYFPEMASVATEGWAGVKLRDLVTMSSGIAWDENRAWTDPKKTMNRICSQSPIQYATFCRSPS